MDLGLSGRAAIVTGASKGIGRAIAGGLVAEGCNVVVCARGAAGLDRATAELAGAAAGTARVVGVAVDVTAADAPALLVERCVAEFGRLDVLVNNAGTAAPRPMAELTAQDWRADFDVLFFAATELAVAAARAMRDAGQGGRIVHVASVSGREPDPWFASYSAAKAALLNMSTSLAKAFGAHAITSNCVLPGITMTELVDQNARASAEQSGTTVDEVIAAQLARIRPALRRFGTVDEVAAAVLFLCSEQARWITGATLEVDGGTLHSA